MQALILQDLTKIYANKTVALKGINLQVEQGDFFALLGPNGAGKSTTIGIITSLVTKTSGKVSVFGYDLDTHPQEVKLRIGLVPQEFNFNIFEKTQDILIKQAGYYGLEGKLVRERSEKYLKLLGIWTKRDTQARFLSGGQKRRLLIARALIHEPPLLILDEPTAGVDIELRREMWGFLQKINDAGTTIILTTHYLEEAENLCKNIAIINHGDLVASSSMKSLLLKLLVQTFILTTAQPIIIPPHLSPFSYRLEDENTLEVDVHSDQNLTDLLSLLQNQGITVTGMRNKANRLEELFLRLTTTKLGE